MNYRILISLSRWHMRSAPGKQATRVCGIVPKQEAHHRLIDESRTNQHAFLKSFVYKEMQYEFVVETVILTYVS